MFGYVEFLVNILIVSDVYFPRVNGVSTSIETFRQELLDRGVRVSVIAPAYGIAQNGAGITRIPSRSVLFDPEDRMMRYRCIIKHIDHLKKQAFDLVHIQTPFVAHYAGTAIAKKLKRPSVVTYHTFFEEYLYHYIPFVPRRWMQGLARRFSRQQCNAVDAVIVPSTAMEERLRTYGVHRPIHRIPTGIPPAQFVRGNRAAFRAQHGIAEDQSTLLYLGRVAFEKNLEFLLRATDLARRDVPSLLLIIAGEGPAEKALHQLTKELGLERHVKFIGYLNRTSTLLDCYSAADAFVFASLTETQGLVLLEAMALGVPVVSTAVMGTRDILADQCGALVAPEDTDGFADAMVRILTNDALRMHLAESAPQCAQAWASGTMAEKLLDLYKNLAHNHDPS